MYKIGGYRPSAGTLNCAKFDSKVSGFIKLATTQATEYIIPEYTPISNQLSLSACVGNACADAAEILKGLEDPNKVQQLSRLFVYYNARNYIKETNKDNGCYIHDALDSLKKLGVCLESTWNYDPSQVLVHPTLEAYKEGNDNTISEFYQITSINADRINDIKTAIKANHTVIFGTEVGPEFENYAIGQVLDPPSKSLGGHAILIAGFRENTDGSTDFWIRNSWGKDFGDNGHCWFSSAYMTWANTQDLFVPTRMPDFLI